MKIFSVDEANESILKRKALNRMEYSPQILQRTEDLFGKGVTPPMAVEIILQSVEEDKDRAIFHWSKVLDGYDGNEISIPRERLKEAWQQLTPQLQNAMQIAANRIRDFHQHQPVNSWMTHDADGELGQRVTPIERIGVYVPGGTAPLPSSVLMSVIPAQVAGVKEIHIATPPDPDSSILAAAYLCEVESVYQIGGAQAIGALAYGTESVPRVDKIVGAGNLFVTLAKQQVFGIVGLDGLAGPTETMVIADGSANPAWVAADLSLSLMFDSLMSVTLTCPSST
jgi:histidinol dehydrogenase